MRTARTKSSQEGSAGFVVFLAVVIGMVWWQWDWISGLFGGGSTVAEVTNFRCVSETGRSVFDGTVRNLSKEPIEVRVGGAVNDTSGRILEAVEAGVRPTPLPPQQSGSFRGDGPVIPDGGSCKLTGVIDASSGRPVSWRRR